MWRSATWCRTGRVVAVAVVDVGRCCAVVDYGGRAIHGAELDAKVIAVAPSLPQEFLGAKVAARRVVGRRGDTPDIAVIRQRLGDRGDRGLATLVLIGLELLR